MIRVTPSLLNAIIQAETPQNCFVLRKFRSGRGSYHSRERILKIPREVSLETLYVFFHELGHALRFRTGQFKCHPRRNTSADEEHIAELFAALKLREYGFHVPHVLTRKARVDVRGHIEKDDRIGWPVAKEVRKWANQERQT